MTYAFGESEQINGAIKLTVFDEEIGASLQQLRVGALVEVFRNELQRSELLRLEGKVERLGEVACLVVEHHGLVLAARFVFVVTRRFDHVLGFAEQRQIHELIVTADLLQSDVHV